MHDAANPCFSFQMNLQSCLLRKSLAVPVILGYGLILLVPKFINGVGRFLEKKEKGCVYNFIMILLWIHELE